MLFVLLALSRFEAQKILWHLDSDKDTRVFWAIKIFDIVVLNDFFESFEFSLWYLGELFFLFYVFCQLFDKTIDLENLVLRKVLFC